MNREDRAKQFAPFDALKGLQEALRNKEAIHEKVEKIELNEENAEKLSKIINRVDKGTKVEITYFINGNYAKFCGIVKAKDTVFQFFVIAETKIYFEDIYDLKVVEYVQGKNKIRIRN